MLTLAANVRSIKKAIRGPPTVFKIENHDRLYLDVRGEGRASWRIRYRPSPNANQRWFTLVDDANHAEFADVALKAHERPPTSATSPAYSSRSALSWSSVLLRLTMPYRTYRVGLFAECWV